MITKKSKKVQKLQKNKQVQSTSYKINSLILSITDPEPYSEEELVNLRSSYKYQDVLDKLDSAKSGTKVTGIFLNKNIAKGAMNAVSTTIRRKNEKLSSSKQVSFRSKLFEGKEGSQVTWFKLK